MAIILSYSFSWNVTVFTLSNTPSRCAWIVWESLAWPRISNKAGSDTKKKRGNTSRFFSRYLCVIYKNLFNNNILRFRRTKLWGMDIMHKWHLRGCYQSISPIRTSYQAFKVQGPCSHGQTLETLAFPNFLRRLIIFINYKSIINCFTCPLTQAQQFL